MDHSLSDARSLALNLGIRFEVVPIGRGFDAMMETFKSLFEGMTPDITEENLQRGSGPYADGAVEQIRCARTDDR